MLSVLAAYWADTLRKLEGEAAEKQTKRKAKLSQRAEEDEAAAAGEASWGAAAGEVWPQQFPGRIALCMPSTHGGGCRPHATGGARRGLPQQHDEQLAPIEGRTPIAE